MLLLIDCKDFMLSKRHYSEKIFKQESESPLLKNDTAEFEIVIHVFFTFD